MNEHQEYLDNIPAYALGILGDEEEAWVAAHMAKCPACTAELHAYQETVGLLGHAAPEAQAPPDLKARVFAQVQPPKPAAKPKKAPWRLPTLAGTPSLSLVGTALILLLTISNFFLWNQVRSLRESTFQVIDLAAESVMPDAKGMIVISADGRYGTLVVSDMDQLDEAHQYQLWLIKDGERTDGGVFSVSQSGYTAFQVYSREPLGSFEDFGITIEPTGGSPGPTGDKVLGADL